MLTRMEIREKGSYLGYCDYKKAYLYSVGRADLYYKDNYNYTIYSISANEIEVLITYTAPRPQETENQE